MKKSYKKLSVLLAVIMTICVFTTYTAIADTLSTSMSRTEVEGGDGTETGIVGEGGEEGDTEDEGKEATGEDRQGDPGDEEGGEEGDTGEEGEEETAGEDGQGDPGDEEDSEKAEKEGETDGEEVNPEEGLGEDAKEDDGEGTEAGIQGTIEPLFIKCKLTVDVEPAGKGTVSPSGGKYDWLSNITMTATATDPTYEFEKWTIKKTFGTETNYNSQFSLEMNGDRKVTAHFSKIQYQVTAKSVDTNKGTVSPDSKKFYLNSTVVFDEHFTPNPKDGYEFNGWLLNGESATSAVIIGDITIEAAFKELSYTLAASVNDATRGSVFPEEGNYKKGSVAEVAAAASEEYKFIRWEYDREKYGGSNNVYSVDGDKITVKMEGQNQAKAVKAIFEPATYDLSTSVSVAPNGDPMGTITPSSGTFNNGDTITLKATPNSKGYEFVGWEYEQEKYDGTKNVYSKNGKKIDVKMRGESTTKCVRAVFKQVKYSVDAYVGTKDADGNTVIAPQMGSVDPVRSEWSMWYDKVFGWEYTRIVATAKPGYQFVEWEYEAETFNYCFWPFVFDVHQVDGNKIKVIMKGDIKAKQVTAIFAPISYKVSSTVSPEGSGSITGDGDYDCGSEVTLTATQNDPSAYTFKQWTGNLPDGVSTNEPTITFTMPAENISLVAEFEEIIVPSQYTLGTSAVNGSITPVSGGTYDEGTTVEIVISPDAGYEFDRWENGDGYTVPLLNAESGKYEVVMSGNILVKVYFKESYTAPTTGTISVSKNVVGEELSTPRAVNAGGSTYKDIVDDREFIVTLYDNDSEPVESKTISEDKGAEFTSLAFGTYYLKEALLTGYARVDDPDNYTEIIVNQEKPDKNIVVVNQKEPEVVLIPGIGITKTVDKPKAYAGNGVKYTITVTNTGETWLTDIVVYDDILNKSWLLRNLEPSEAITFVRDYTIPSDKKVNDKITNTATVSANEYFELEALSVPDGDILAEDNGNMLDEYGGDYRADATATVTIIEKTIDRPSNPGGSSDSGTYSLRMAVDGQGTVSPGIGVSKWSKGTNVKLTATPAEGWKFDGWQGDAVSASNLLKMDGNKSVTAVFSLIVEDQEPEVLEIEDEPLPNAPANEPRGIQIEDEEVPSSPAEELPETGGVPAGVFYGLGGLIAAVGALLRRKAKR